MPLVKSLMTPFPHSVDRRCPLDEAWAFMREHGIHHLPVTGEEGLIGIVTDRDIKLFLGPDFDYPLERESTVEDVYVREPYIVDSNSPLAPVLKHMAEQHIGSVLVTRKGKLAGIFTATDACRAYSDMLTKLYPSGGDEAA